MLTTPWRTSFARGPPGGFPREPTCRQHHYFLPPGAPGSPHTPFNRLSLFRIRSEQNQLRRWRFSSLMFIFTLLACCPNQLGAGRVPATTHSFTTTYELSIVPTILSSPSHSLMDTHGQCPSLPLPTTADTPHFGDQSTTPPSHCDNLGYRNTHLPE